MADIVKTTGYNTPCLLQNGNYCDWINAAFKFELSKTSDGQKYNCKVWVSLYTSENMNWSGDGTMNLTARWYDKRTQSWETFSDSKETSTPLYTSEGGTDWSGGLSFQFAAYTDEIEFTVDNDLLRTICDNHHMAVGPDYVNAGTHFQHFILSGYRINVQSLPLLTAPQISGSLTNTTPYRNPVDGKTYYNISAYETSVGLKYTKSGGDDEDTYRHWHRTK